jgi:hypothetical protein
MVTFKCPGCKHHFNNSCALRTHKQYGKTQITAVVTKLLDQHNFSNLEKRKGKRVRLKNVEEELENEGGEDVDVKIPSPVSVSQILHF